MKREKEKPAPGQRADSTFCHVGPVWPDDESILRLYKSASDPVVAGEPLGDLVVVRCPWCGKVHYHGRGDGHRVAHCITPRERRGYTIREEP